MKLAANGYAVFPCKPDKSPAVPGGFKAASTDPDQIGRIWYRWPGPLIGVRTGQASLVAVLDLDAKHPTAKEWWREHREQLMPTRVHRTRSGGLHLVYGVPDDTVKCSAGKIAPGVDVRGANGYVIWWPAHGCAVLAEGPIAPWPPWLDELLKPLPAPPRPPPRPRPDIAGQMPVRDMVTRLEGLVAFVEQAPEGERNNRLFWAACRVTEMAAVREITASIAELTYEELAGAAAAIGLSQHEIERTLNQARNQ